MSDDNEEYRAGRGSRPAEGPGQTDSDAKSSLPPGADLKPDDDRGDVDQDMPYEGDPAPDRMVDQPLED
jgi:hypothetical protein